MSFTRNAIDFHMHSTFSDGSMPPEELVKLADQAGLAACVLTDHDTLDGVPGFLAAGKNYPDLELFSGVEISTRYGYREIHIVGLGVDIKSAVLNRFLSQMRQERWKRAELMADKLAGLGYPLPESWKALEVVGRMHFAELLKENYSFTSINEVFEKLLRRGTAGYVPRILPPPVEVISAIHAAGGVAIWAHPLYSQMRERSWGKKVLRHLVPMGIDGMEGHYSGFTEEQMIMVKGLAADYQLFLSGGSDFHGAGHEGVAIGTGYGDLHVPIELLGVIKEKIKFYQEHRTDEN